MMPQDRTRRRRWYTSGMPEAAGDPAYRVIRTDEPARTIVLAPEAGGAAPQFVIADAGEVALPAVIHAPRLAPIADAGGRARVRLVCREGEFEVTARGFEVLESPPGFYDESLAPFTLRARDRTVVGWLLRLLRLPGGTWLLRAWHTRRN